MLASLGFEGFKLSICSHDLFKFLKSMIMIQSVSELLKVKKGKAGTVPSHIFCRSWRLGRFK